LGGWFYCHHDSAASYPPNGFWSTDGYTGLDADPAPVVGVYETGSQLAMWGGSERWVHTEMKFKVNEKWCPWNSLVKMNEDLSHLRIMMADLLDWCSHRCWFIGRISPI